MLEGEHAVVDPPYEGPRKKGTALGGEELPLLKGRGKGGSKVSTQRCRPPYEGPRKGGVCSKVSTRWQADMMASWCISFATILNLIPRGVF